jgi:hypothetical protein
MNHHRAIAGPSLRAVPRLEAFEERTVPAHVGWHGHADASDSHDGPAAHRADDWTGVEGHHAKAYDQLTAWLGEESFFADGPDRSEHAHGRNKGAGHVELDNQGSLTTLDDSLTANRSEKGGAKPVDQGSPPTTPDIQPLETKHVQATSIELTVLDGKPVEARTYQVELVTIIVTILAAEARPTAHPHAVGHAEPAEHSDPAQHTDPAPHPESSDSLVVAPVSAEAVAVAPETAVAHLAPTAEPPRAAPLQGQRPATSPLPNLVLAAGEAASVPGGANGAPPADVVADPPGPAVPAEQPERPWAPAVAQVSELVSRFVPLDPNSVEQSVDEFIEQLHQNRDLVLTPRQAGLLAAVVAAGLAGGEIARRHRLPQRVTQLLSRTKFFSGTKTV